MTKTGKPARVLEDSTRSSSVLGRKSTMYERIKSNDKLQHTNMQNNIVAQIYIYIYIYIYMYTL